MIRSIFLILALALGQSVLVSAQSVPSPASHDLFALMPEPTGYGSMWWGKGFPSHSPNIPWHRYVQTGHYGFVLDTQMMQVPHLGPIDSQAITDLPSAELTLRIKADGKTYDCTAGGQWSRKTGPRLIESGRFFQRGDVTDLVFESTDGDTLNVDARMETVVWPDRLGLILYARPGEKSIPRGETSFGRVAGGYGLDGDNDFEIPHSPKLDTETFTLSFWAFVPEGYRASDKTFPWLVCKNRNEAHPSNFGITLVAGKPAARINIGGGPKNAFTAASPNSLKFNAWSHLAIRYDGQDLRLSVNGQTVAAQSVDIPRVPGKNAMTFGRREDNFGDGYHFRGVIDEIAFFDSAIDDQSIRQLYQRPESADGLPHAVQRWSFREEVQSAMQTPKEQWKSCELKVGLRNLQGILEQSHTVSSKNGVTDPSWQQVALTIDPVTFRQVHSLPQLSVTASEIGSDASRPVDYDPAMGWHRVNLDGVVPIVPDADANLDTDLDVIAEGVRSDRRNDSMERISLLLSNPSDSAQVARLMFEKTRSGFRQRIGSPITGVSAILRDSDGIPTGIPVQLSKNWHADGSDDVHARQWFHGISQVRLPPRSKIQLELSLVYGHWGGLPAASSSQLSLIGWGSNQLWNQAAVGSWGESVCFEPDQVQANCSVTDVRPLMLQSKPKGEAWRWTANVGGGDYFRLFDPAGKRVPHTAMRTTFNRYGPCLTETAHRGQLGPSIQHGQTISLSRSDDITRVTYQLKMNVTRATDFSRFVVFQIGADTYNFTRERKMAMGNHAGLINEWQTKWGGNQYRTALMQCSGKAPWVSLHDAVPEKERPKPEAWANRGIVIRSWKAKLGGQDASPWVAEHGVVRGGNQSSTLDIVPPPGVDRLEPGDFVEATIEHLIIPQDADDYYGPDASLRTALNQHANSWQMIHREATINDRRATVAVGELTQSHPDLRIRAVNDKAEFTLAGGIGYVPMTFTGLTSPKGYMLTVNGETINQSVHGNDFWQTDYDPKDQRWSRTYNIACSDHGLDGNSNPENKSAPVRVQFGRSATTPTERGLD